MHRRETNFDRFRHKHPLTFYDENHAKGSCAVCDQPISGDFYSCKRCNFYIDISCAELKEKTEHPFHREHSLILLADSPYESGGFTCSACSVSCEGFLYHCPDCKFDLDINCASLILKSTKNYTNHLEHQTHPHPLISCHNNKSSDYSCHACLLPITGTIYACASCVLFLHKSCAQLPQEIQHPFHPLHSLTLLTHSPSQIAKDPENFSCNACGEHPNLSYHCSKCAFCLDVKCATLMPTINCETPKNHPHPLIACDAKGKFDICCSACELAFEGTIYVCFDCKFLLHKSCAELAPVLIKHPFHPQHPLVLDHKLCNDRRITCGICRERICGLRYWCKKYCTIFSIDIACASIRPNVKFGNHQHPLAFINKSSSSLIICSICRRSSYYPFCCCVPCNFNLCMYCVLTLPHTFKHSYHRHSLTLTETPIKDNSDDDGDSEYYCEICEKRRFLQDPTYYCEECHYVAHIHCVFSEILSELERESSLAGGLDGHKNDPGVKNFETKNASTDQKTLLSAASDDPSASEQHYC